MQEGTVLGTATGNTSGFPDQHSIQVDENMHLSVKGSGLELVSHACNPNCVLKVKHNESINEYAISLIVKRNIKPGETLSWDYETTEYELSHPFECCCGDSSCRHWIRGYRFWPSDQKVSRMNELSPFLQRLTLSNKNYATQ